MNEQQRFPSGSQLQQDLADSLDVLRTRGWCQNNFTDDAGHVCLIGAVSTAIYGKSLPPARNLAAPGQTTRYHDATRALIQALPSTYQADGLTYYNDRRVKTVRPVISLLKRAIAAPTPTKGPR